MKKYIIIAISISLLIVLSMILAVSKLISYRQDYIKSKRYNGELLSLNLNHFKNGDFYAFLPDGKFYTTQIIDGSLKAPPGKYPYHLTTDNCKIFYSTLPKYNITNKTSQLIYPPFYCNITYRHKNNVLKLYPDFYDNNNNSIVLSTNKSPFIKIINSDTNQILYKIKLEYG